MFEITLRINDLNTEDEEKAKQAIKDLVVTLTADLNMAYLDSIVYTSWFENDVIAFQKEKQIQQGFTQSSFGSAAAKAISYIENEQEKHTIFLQDFLFWTLFNDETNNFAANTLHHELAHVHDDSLRFQTYTSFHISRSDDFMTIACKIGEIMWMEFIADRLAISTFTEQSDLRIDDVRKLAISLLETTSKNRNEYLFDGNAYKVFVELQQESNLLLNITGNLLGRVHGLKLQDQIERLPMEYFTPYLIRFSEELERLYSIYPNWKGMKELLPLANIIVDLWETLGVSFEADHEGISIRLNGTPE